MPASHCHTSFTITLTQINESSSSITYNEYPERMFAKSYSNQSYFMLIFHALIIFFFSNALPLKNITCPTMLFAVHFCPVNVLCLFVILLFIPLVDDTIICHLICHLHLININCAHRNGFSHQKMAQRVCKWKKYQKAVPKIIDITPLSSEPTGAPVNNEGAFTLFCSLRCREFVFNNHTACTGKPVTSRAISWCWLQAATSTGLCLPFSSSYSWQGSVIWAGREVFRQNHQGCFLGHHFPRKAGHLGHHFPRKGWHGM